MITKTMNPVVALFALILTGVFAGISSVAAADGEALLRRVDEIRAPSSNFSFTTKVETSDGTSIGLDVTVKDRNKSLVRYIDPPRSMGRVILFVGPNMWVYIPGSRRVLRISPRQQVLGGVSSTDVARTVYSDDYGVTSVEETDDTVLLHLSATSKAAAYGRIDLTVAPSGAPRAAIFFAANGDHKLKTAYFEDYQPVLGGDRPTRMRVVDHLDGDSVTTLTYSDYEIVDSPEAWFQPSYLNRM